jgi:uroporphyrinogen decarboxylase
MTNPAERDGFGIFGAGKPDFQRVITAVRGEEPDRIPVMELDVDSPVKSAFLGKRTTTVGDDLEFWYQAGYDYIYQRPNYDFAGVTPNASVGTPLRMKAQMEMRSDDAKTSSDSGDIRISVDEDYERYPWPDPDSVDFSNMHFIAENLPPGMGVISGVGGIFTRAWTIMGLENFCIRLLDGDAIVEQVLQRVAEIQCRVLERLLDIPQVGMIWVGDDFGYTEGLMLSPEAFRRMIFPHLEKLIRITHQAGRMFILHSDGDVWKIMDDLIEMGMDALHPWEPKAMSIAEGKKRIGNRIGLIGNIDLIHTLPFGTEREIISEVRQRIRECGYGGGYGLGSANTVTRYVPVENFRTMMNATLRHGRYPLQD